MPESDQDPWPRPKVTTDAVVFAVGGDGLEVLLIERKHAPFEGAWALPGGHVDEGESLEACVLRELAEETGVSEIELAQFRAFGDPGRDPRGWYITVAFAALVDKERIQLAAASDARAAGWHPVFALPPLAFDHAKIIAYAVDYIQAHFWQPACTQALPMPLRDGSLAPFFQALNLDARQGDAIERTMAAGGLITPLDGPGPRRYTLGLLAMHHKARPHGGVT